jgi:hypothetical protein
VVLAVLAAGCATPERPPPLAAPAAPLPPLPRSSIAAVLARAGELRLTADQVNSLRELDDNLQKAQAALRGQGRGRGRGGQASGAGAPPGGGPSMGMGGGGRGMGGGRRMGGGRGAGRGTRPAVGDGDAESRRAALEDKLDSQDTEAYLHAEALLTAEQQPRAREIAERYREQLSDRRQAEEH